MLRTTWPRRMRGISRSTARSSKVRAPNWRDPRKGIGSPRWTGSWKTSWRRTAGATGRPMDGGLGPKLVTALKFYWINRGYFGLGHQVTVEALARATSQRARPGALSRPVAGGPSCASSRAASTRRARFLRREPRDRARTGSQGRRDRRTAAARHRVDPPRELGTARVYLDESLALAGESRQQTTTGGGTERSWRNSTGSKATTIGGRALRTRAGARARDRRSRKHRRRLAQPRDAVALGAGTGSSGGHAARGARDRGRNRVEDDGANPARCRRRRCAASRDDAPARRACWAPRPARPRPGLHRHRRPEAFRCSSGRRCSGWRRILASEEARGPGALDFTAAMQEVGASLAVPPDATRGRTA